MNIVSRLSGRLGRALLRQSGMSSVELWEELVRGRKTRSGISLTPLKAMQVSTASACALLIAEGLGSLPIALRRRTDAGAEDYAGGAAFLLDEPNEWMTWQEVCQMLTLHAVLGQDGYAIIQRNFRGEPLALLPLPIGMVRTEQLRDWTIQHHVTWPDGTRTTVPFVDMLHLRGPSMTGAVGLDVLHLARESIGLAAAIEWAQADHFGAGPTPPGYLSVEGKVTEPQAEEAQKRWAAMVASGKIAVLSNSSKFTQLTLDFASAQTIETRKLQVEEICRAFRVFPQMIGMGGRTTYASAEAFFAAHVQHTLRPWATRWEQTLRRDLLTPDERRNQFFRIDIGDMLRGDLKGRAAYYTVAVQMGWMTPNQVREAEGLNRAPPADGLDSYLRPVNLAPADLAALLAPDPAQPPPPDPAAI
jgi:HK97 family phage portal protein